MSHNDTHSVVASENNHSDTMMASVPADVQREEDIAIDDLVEVTIYGLSGPFTSVSFERRQRSGDYVAIPAEIARTAGIENKAYDMSFEKVEEDTEDDATESFEEMMNDATESDEEEEEEEPGLGELFS